MKKITFLMLACLTTAGAFAQTFSGSGGAIPDNSCTVAHEFPITVTGVGVLGVANAFSSIGFDITHPFDGDLDISLIAPNGTIIEISTDNGATGDNYTNTIISPDATTLISAGVVPFTGSFLPEGSLAALQGITADGTWILRVCDDGVNDLGTLNSWSITFAPAILDAPDMGNIQSPLTATIAQGGSVTVHGEVFESGLTDIAPNIVGQASGIQAWVAVNATDTNPNTWTTWVPAAWNSANVSNNDEYQLVIGTTLNPGTYYYAFRYKLNSGPYVFGGTNSFWNGTSSVNGVLTVTPPPPPANDECSGAVALTVNADYACGTVTPGTVAAATASAIDVTACFGTEDDDVWYSFVATATTHRISLLNIAGSATDMYHSLWTGDCTGLTLVTGSCSDPNTSNPTGLVIGQTYYVRVYTWTATGNQNTTFNICIGTPPPPPVNDECAGAIALTVNPDLSCGSVTAGTVQSATASSTDASACSGTEDDDVWFSFVATATSHKISLTNVAGSVTDMYHSLWTGNCSSLTLVTCSDPDVSNPTGLVIGQTYYIRVNTSTATVGQNTTFNICIGTPPPPPVNDECSGAIALTINPDLLCGSVTAGTIQSATASAVDATACAGNEDDDVWFSFVATTTNPKISLLNVTGSATDMYHSLWTGDCTGLTLVAGSCSDADTSNPEGLVIGQTYYVRVNSFTATGGQTTTFNICIGTNPPPPANDECIGAIALTAGGIFADNVTTTTSLGATKSDGLSPSCQTNFASNVWYTVVVPDSGNITIETQVTGSGYTDSVVSAFTGTCGGTLTAVGCDDDGGPAGANNLMSKLSLVGQTPGSTLYISVWRFGGGIGVNGTFNISAYDASLANGSFDNANFTFYPNPVKNVLNLSYNKEISNVEIFNLVGQQVISNKVNANNAQIDMSPLSNGTYMVKVTSDNQVKTLKVIKQ